MRAEGRRALRPRPRARPHDLNEPFDHPTGRRCSRATWDRRTSRRRHHEIALNRRRDRCPGRSRRFAGELAGSDSIHDHALDTYGELRDDRSVLDANVRVPDRFACDLDPARESLRICMRPEPEMKIDDGVECLGGARRLCQRSIERGLVVGREPACRLDQNLELGREMVVHQPWCKPCARSNVRDRCAVVAPLGHDSQESGDDLGAAFIGVRASAHR
jgi:hypothetical protein